MKTKTFLLATVLLATVLASCEKLETEPVLLDEGAFLKAQPVITGSKDTTDLSDTRTVYYEVNITVRDDNRLCNTYWVELTDGNGENIAPKQVYVPGTTRYVFKERIRMRSGLRIAKLVLSPAMNPGCETEWYTEQDAKVIQFNGKETFYFELLPQRNPKDGM